MALLDSVLSGGVGQLVKDVVGTFKLSPEAKAEFDAKVAEHEFELKKLDAEMAEKAEDALAKEVDVAGANIRSETGSSDKFTSRARPAFLYIVEAILMWNYAICRIFGMTPVDLPSNLLVLFGICITGYVTGRSGEKIANIMGMK